MLMFMPVMTYAIEAPALLDTDAVSNLILSKLFERLSLVQSATCNTITVANSSSYGCIGSLSKVLVLFGHLATHIDFLGTKDPPLGLIIGILALRRLHAVINCRTLFMGSWPW